MSRVKLADNSQEARLWELEQRELISCFRTLLDASYKRPGSAEPGNDGTARATRSSSTVETMCRVVGLRIRYCNMRKRCGLG